MRDPVSVFFIAEGDHLTAQALLLAASLRFHNGPEPRLIAYVPEGSDPVPDPARAAFDVLAVDLRPLPIENGFWKSGYPHGNKLFACAAPRDPGLQIFMDSDMVCVASLSFGDLAPFGSVAVVPEGTPTWGKTGDRWARLYAHFDLPLPEDRVHLVRRRRIEFLPYFNAGFVAFRTGAGQEERRFPDLWLETAREIDWNAPVGSKRPWLDQISLPVTLKRFGLEYQSLPDVWNFSISDRAFEPDARPRVIHYHSFRFASVWPQVRAEIARMSHRLGPALMADLTPLYGGHWYRLPEPAA
ncbi:hypothetical protein [Oceaniovalibus sp. ACAM 378]|uniref:hypothetical protein n=1 Tax=Oceaniovalibus sp. ACAM 378 TaxID=2599923 RepID=UPI0011D8DF73|nr:hypothetical protein [Oceaniovalibus sp. ACAM 378]TYB91161.1 hypothetical protein FQ320_01285 [Oceaniovalibus sp. ACAM 378]